MSPATKRVEKLVPKPIAQLIAFHPLPADNLDSRLFEVRTVRTGVLLGTIHWHTAWRQYVFVSVPGGQYTREVLRGVTRKLYRLMYEWRLRRDEPPRRGLPALSHAERRARRAAAAPPHPDEERTSG